MIEIALVTQAIGAAAAGLKLIDQIADQITDFIEGRRGRKTGSYREFARTIEAEGDKLVSSYHGQVEQVITAEQIQEKLTDEDFEHVKVLEKAMENHYRVWKRVYPELALLDSVQKAKVEAQLEDIVQDMKEELLGILAFIESCGFTLDDHYLKVRRVVTTA